jgi:transcriptional regulator with GAF, ATPase, and Fis domain
LALRKQIQQEYLLTEIAQDIRQSLDLNQVLSITVHRVRAFLGADRVLIFRIQPNGQGDVIMESVGVGWISTLSCSIFDQCFNGDRYLPTYRQGKVTIQSDIETTGLEPCYVEFLQQYQVKAKLVAPILQNEHLWGLLIVHQCSETRVWQGDEVAAIQRITTQLGIAIQQAELYQQLETELKERQQAEQQIRQQTALLNQTNQLLELFIRYAPVGIAMFDRQMQYVAVSQRWVDEYHLGTIESILHRSHYDIFPDLPERWKVIHQRALAGGIEKCDEDLFIREDGQFIYPRRWPKTMDFLGSTSLV